MKTINIKVPREWHELDDKQFDTYSVCLPMITFRLKFARYAFFAGQG